MQVFRAILNILSGFRVHPELAAKLILFVIHISYFVVHPKSYYILSILIYIEKRYLAYLVWVEVDSEFAAKLTLFV